MLQQYFEAKARAGDALLFYRMGDFYELFFEDALTASRVLGLTLTARHRDSDVEAPMCGVPHHAAEGYIAALVAGGFRVAICDQVEDARQARGLVRREITRIVSPGTVIEAESLRSADANYLGAVAVRGTEAGLALLDLSTGAFRACRTAAAEAGELLSAAGVREVLMSEDVSLEVEGAARTIRPAHEFAAAAAADLLCRAFGVVSVEALGFAVDDPAIGACAAALAYARENRRSDAVHVEPPVSFDPRGCLRIEPSTLRHLEIFESSSGAEQATLIAVLDSTKTPMGRRALREALARPFLEAAGAEARLESVAELVSRADVRQVLQDALSPMGDLARRVARVTVGAAGPREVGAMADALERLPGLKAAAAMCESSEISRAGSNIPDVSDAVAEIRRCLVAEPPALISAGGAIRAEADPELASLSELKSNAHGALAAFEAKERERTGLSTLKVRFHRVFGYSLEISRAQKDRAPSDYIRRQTLANAERYSTPELADLESKILGAEERIAEIEARIFAELTTYLAGRGRRLAEGARRAGEIDLLASLAETAVRRGYSRPRVSDERRIRIVDGRHPVVEATRGGDAFVPNDVDLGPENRIVVLTGPNMGGKSTFLRQVALISILARAGSFVPAREAEIGRIDRVFTRIGAADHLARGESTFMVEMIEASNILRNATPSSLIILDEMGRGTSTFDGLSLAWAMVEHLRDVPGRQGFALFATHYHEMTDLASTGSGVANFSMAVREWEGKVIFLRKVVPGGADRSYGIHVAEIAGLPAPVIARAREILGNLDQQELDVRGRPKLARHEGEAARPAQLQLFTGHEELVLEKLRDVDVDHLTPVSALALLASLQERVRK